MMNFDDFKESVVDHIKDYLPEQYQNAQVTLQEVTKSNDITLTGLMIKNEDSNIAPNIYLEGYFEQYNDGRDMVDILQAISDVRVNNELAQGFDTERITAFDRVKDNITCRLVNKEMNSEFLANRPYTQFEDLAVVYAVDLGAHQGGIMTAPINNNMMEQYGVTVEQLHAIALDNLAKSDIDFKSMRDTIIEMMGITGDDPAAELMLPPEDGRQMYILSNKEKIDGASSILDAKTLNDISEKFGGDFVVLPSSRHEVIVLPMSDDMDRHVLESMVKEVNAGQVAPEDRLSDHVYQYDAENHELLRMDKLEQRRAERDENRDKGVERKPEKSRTSMKDRLNAKKAEVAKNESSREHVAPAKSKEAALA